jgi:prepilin-type processing-associated H-X9-DG protein
MNHRAGSFSLTELLVVIAIVLILLVVVIVGTEQVYGSSIRLRCQHRLEQIGQACQMYAAQNRGAYPKAWDMYSRRRWYETLAEDYLSSPDVLGCPSAGAVVVESIEAPDPPEQEYAEEMLDALRWLQSKQCEDGRWDVSATNGNRGRSDNGITALALMAFLGYGCTDKYPEEFADTVARAIQYLVDEQRKEGESYPGWWYGNRTPYTDKIGYEHSICVMAMAQAYVATGDPDCKNAAQNGLDFLLDRQDTTHGHGGFGYDNDHDDISVTGWAMQAIWAGGAAGLDVPEVSRQRVETCLEIMVHTDGTYRTFYRYRPGYTSTRDHNRTRAATAISLTARLLMGHEPGNSANYNTKAGRCRGQLDWLQSGDQHLAHARQDSHLLYFYYYMTLANSLLGGEHWEEWETEVFPDELLALQAADGHFPRGICTWGSYGGDVYTTALACMTLEASFEGHWEMMPAAGSCSYGYSMLVGETGRTPGPDTILVADSTHWAISPDDEPVNLAPRHLGKVNILFGDGHVRAVDPDDITDGLWTLDTGD